MVHGSILNTENTEKININHNEVSNLCPPLANVIKLRKKLSSECHPVLVTGSNELPEGPFLESIGFIFRFRDKPGMTALIELRA
jgi:hypothetical protein